MALKKRTFLIGLTIFAILVLTLVTSCESPLKNFAGSTFGGSGSDCAVEKFVNHGKSYDDLNELRIGMGFSFTDEELLDGGFSVKNDGVYLETCK